MELPTEPANFAGQRPPGQRVTEIAGNALQHDIVRALVRVSFQALEKIDSSLHLCRRIYAEGIIGRVVY